MATLECRDCHSGKIVWDWACGDIVCTNCGLVQEERFIDDRVPYKDYHDYEREHYEGVNRTVKKHLEGMGIDDYVVENVNSWCAEETVRKADVAAGLHTSMVGVSVKSVCDKMNISQSKFWKAVSKKKESLSDCGSMMRRFIYEAKHVPSERAWDIIRVGYKIIEAIKDSKHIQTLKPDKLALSIVIISCEISGIGIKRNRACKEFIISPDTVRKHELLIQDLLKKNSSGKEETIKKLKKA